MSADASAPAAEPSAPDPGLRATLAALVRSSRGYGLVNLVNFGDGVAYFGFLALLTLFLEVDAGFSTHWSTVSVSLFTGAVTVFMAVGGGSVSDRLGVRRALSLSLAFVLAGRVLLTLAPSAGPAQLVPALVGLALLVTAFGEGIIQPALYAGVKEYTDRRTATVGYAFLYSIMNLGIVAGEALSPLVRERWASAVEGVRVEASPAAGITGAFWFFIAVTAATLAANLAFFTRRVEARDRVAREPAAARRERVPLAARLRALPILDARFQFFIFVLLAVRTLFAHQWLTMPHYVVRAFPPDVGARWEWVNGLNPLIIVVFVPIIAIATRRRAVVDMMILGTLVSALATGLLLPAPSLPLLLAYVVVFSLGEAVWSSRFLEYVAELAPPNRVGVYMGLAGIPWFLAKSVTGLYSGWMLDRFVPADGPQDPGTLWLVYGLVALVSPVGLLLARGWLRRPRSAGAPAAAAGARPRGEGT
jgi:MFS family permease